LSFKDSSQVEQVITKMRETDLPRARNRAKINSLFNGDPPYTESEASENSIETNVNFLEATNIAHDARRQFSNAFLKSGNFFTVSLDGGPVHKRYDWGKIITKEINKRMKRSLAYVECRRSTFAQVVLHGKGPALWEDKFSWCPKAYGIEDVLLPSKTLVSMENLDHFAVFCQYTAGALYRKTHGKVADPAWNKPMVEKLLSNIKDKAPGQSDGYNEMLSPEKLQERFKANAGYYDSDAAPTIDCWKFFSRDPESDEGWTLKMVLDKGVEAIKEGDRKFLYESNRSYGKDISNLIHFQFADGANVAPFRYHSVRSLGFMLYAVCHLQNRLRCRISDAAFEQMLWYFRMQAADDRERLEKVNLHHLGIIPDGLSFVTGQERFKPDEAFIGMVMGQNRQSMSESSSAFTQNVNDGTVKEMTATETMARVNSMNAMVSGMLVLAYTYETYAYREICRRFCIKDSANSDVMAFRKECSAQGIPDEFLNVERWNVEPERTMGQGNKMLEIAQAEKLLAVKPQLDPDAQREVLHIYVEANTDDPQMAERLVPVQKPKVNDAVHDAQLASGALMMGLPVAVKQGINHIDYVEASLTTLAQVVQRIDQSGGMATEEQIIGLQNYVQHIEQHIAIIAQDENEKQRVKQYGDILGKLSNEIRAYVQRLQEAMQKQAQQGAGMDPAKQADLQLKAAAGRLDLKNKELKSQQQLAHKDQAFAAEQRRKDQSAQLEANRKIQQTHVDTAATDLKTRADIINEGKKAEAKAAAVE
jgi:hypothetical protein